MLADLTIKTINGNQFCIGTDSCFTVGTGRHRYADIEIGEKQDFQIDAKIVSLENFSENAIILDHDYSCLQPQYGPQVKRKQFLSAKKIWLEVN